MTYTDEYCSQEVSANVGLYNDVKVGLTMRINIATLTIHTF